MPASVSTSPAHLPIGVFDSGVGGLTVLRALATAMPEEHFIYLGDTARLPYGTKSPETIRQYAQQAAGILINEKIKLLVIACNTASAHALEHLQHIFPSIPIVGVITPGAAAAAAASRKHSIVVTATEATVQAESYKNAIRALLPHAKIQSIATPLFVSLAEEGLTEGSIVEQIAYYYLQPFFPSQHTAETPDCLVLGCTHFPVLAKTLQSVVGPSVAVVDSASTTAQTVLRYLHDHSLLYPSNDANEASQKASIRYFVTDTPSRFARIAAIFLPWSLEEKQISLVDLI